MAPPVDPPPKKTQKNNNNQQQHKNQPTNLRLPECPLPSSSGFHFPHDAELARREIVDSFMFGPRYLAAPVLEQGATTRTLYLPASEGGWTHYYTREAFPGGANVTVNAPFDELPLFQRNAVTVT